MVMYNKVIYNFILQVLIAFLMVQTVILPLVIILRYIRILLCCITYIIILFYYNMFPSKVYINGCIILYTDIVININMIIIYYYSSNNSIVIISI